MQIESCQLKPLLTNVLLAMCKRNVLERGIAERQKGLAKVTLREELDWWQAAVRDVPAQ